MDKKRQSLCGLLKPVVAEIEGAAWNADLAARLDARFPAEGALFQEIEAACAEGIA